MSEQSISYGVMPANAAGNDLYDTGISVEHYLALEEPSREIELAADLADEVALQLSAVLKFVPETQMFVGWNGRGYEANVEHHLRQSIRKAGTPINNRFSFKKFRQRKFIEDVIWALRDHPKIRQSIIDFDADAYELNTPDGLVNLRTGKASSHPNLGSRPLVMKLTRVGAREERCEVFHKFLDDVTDCDKGLQEYLQVLFGACLSGSPETHWMAFLNGPTRSGKSLIVELLAHVMGDYSHTTDGSLFRKNSNDADANPKLYALMGKRLVIASEVDHGHFDDIMIKQLTGDSHITTRALYQNTVTFPRTFKIIVVGNSIPSSSETSKALEARLEIVPFSQSFLGREDFLLPAKLRREESAGYILHWLIQGHVKYLNFGRKLPDCFQVLEAKRNYFSDLGTPRQWLEERCFCDDGQLAASKYVTVGEAHEDFRRWKQERGETGILSQRKFKDALGQVNTAKSNGIRLVGVRLKKLYIQDWNIGTKEEKT